MKKIALVLALVLLIPAAWADAEKNYVPDQETAIKIAVAIWEPIYGKEQIENQKPYVAELQGDVWHVHGSLPEGWLGGTAEAEISKKDGKILKVIHGE